jgi:hypothetical protein
MRTIHLLDANLDFAVAKALRLTPGIHFTEYSKIPYIKVWDGKFWSDFSPSSDARVGLPIIEQRKISTKYWVASKKWAARYNDDQQSVFAERLLIAAMRSLVKFELGDEVTLPRELSQNMKGDF